MDFNQNPSSDIPQILLYLGLSLLAMISGGLIVAGVMVGNHNKESYCKSTYGNSFYYINGDRSPSFCTNSKGDVRYPKNW